MSTNKQHTLSQLALFVRALACIHGFAATVNIVFCSRYGCQNPIPTRGPNRPVVKKGKIMFSLSSVILFWHYWNARSGFLRFFNLYDRSRPENLTKRGEIDSFRIISKVLVYNLESFSLRYLFEKIQFQGNPQKHFGNSRRFGPLIPTPEGRIDGSSQVYLLCVAAQQK